MSGVVTAIVGTGLVSAYVGSQQADAATDAANIQAGSANQANQLQYQMFLEQQRLMQPWVQSGQGNLARLNYSMYGQTPSAQSMIVDPNSQEYKNYFASNPQAPPPPQNALVGGVPAATSFAYPPPANGIDYTVAEKRGFEAQGLPYGGAQTAWNVGGTPTPGGAGATLYRNPITGELTTTPPDMSGQMGVAPGGLNPDWRFSTEDWKNSPEYEVYNNARDAALTRSQDALMAQGAASGMYGSGTMANALAQNMGQLYAQYDPQSLAAAQQSAIGQRNTQYNMMAGMSNPQGAQQVAGYAGQYGQNAGQNMLAAGNAQAAGQVGSANAWGNAMTSGVNQVANAYGQYQGRQNFNRWMQPQQWQVPISSGYNPGGTYETYGWD